VATIVPSTTAAIFTVINSSRVVNLRRGVGRTANDAAGVSADGLGNVYTSGFTEGSLDGPNAGDYEAFVAKLVPVPEPTGVALTLVAALGVLVLRREGKKRT
jgi:hypothetical protein